MLKNIFFVTKYGYGFGRIFMTLTLEDTHTLIIRKHTFKSNISDLQGDNKDIAKFITLFSAHRKITRNL